MQEPYFCARCTTRFCILYARCKITHLFYYAQTFVLIFCNNVNLRSLLQSALAVIVVQTIWIKRRTGFDFSSFCHMHNLLGIGYVDAFAVEHVVKLLLSLVKHGPIVVGFDPYAHHEVDAAVGQGFDSHKWLVGIG